MRTRILPVILGIGAAVLAAGTADAASRARTRAAKGRLTPAAAARERGTIQVKCWYGSGGTTARECVRVSLRGLDRGVTYQLWADDPDDGSTLPVRVPPYTVVATSRGNAGFGWDTRNGGALPFGATTAELAGRTFQVRDASGETVLSGAFPAMRTR